MSFLKKIRMLRRQNDIVKLIFISVIAGIAFLACGVVNIVRLYKVVNSPVEYILPCGSGSVVTGSELGRLMDIKNVEAVSRQSEKTDMIKYKGANVGLSYVALSEEYAERVYGIKKRGGMRTYYMNREAYNMYIGELWNAGVFVNENVEEFRVSLTEDGVAARLAVIDMERSKEPFVFTVEDTVELEKNTTGIRVYMGRQDMEESGVSALGKSGYTIQNEDTVIGEQYKRLLLLSDIKYQVLIAILCLFFAIILGLTQKNI